MSEIINVTKPFLPPIEEYEAYLENIWHEGWLTNNGPIVKKFEEEIKTYLGVDDFQFLTNGMLGLQLAISGLEIGYGDEIITTPFSYVATTTAILWQGATPVFVDIDPNTLCIDANKIEDAITPKTKAIMAVHVFGNACDVEAIDAIAKKHNLKVIYDGAHAFGARYKGKSLLDYGDISMVSFHSTKLFHTIEGGGVICRDPKISNRINLQKRFGHHGDEHYLPGINAKPSEFQAAMGLCNLKYIRSIIQERGELVATYNSLLAGNKKYRHQRFADDLEVNNAYYPLIFESEEALLEAVKRLNQNNIFPRRYFYPSLDTLPYTDQNNCPISDDIAKRIICLPLFNALTTDMVVRICKVMQ